MIIYNAIGGAGDLKSYIEWQDWHKVIPLNVLISFPYLAGSYNILKDLRENGRIGNLFLDAGTFTLNEGKRGSGPRPKTRFSEYVHYVAMYHDCFDRIAAYDEDFDHSAINQELLATLEKRLLKPGTNRPAMSEAEIKQKIVPVLHSEDPDVVEEFTQYAENGYRCVALGSKPIISLETLNKVKEVALANDSVQLHHFGSTSPKDLSERKPDSADSTGFLKAGAFGCVSWLKPGSTALDELEKFDLLPLTKELKEDGPVKQKHPSLEFENYLFGTYHWTINDLAADPSKRAAVNLHAVMEMERLLSLPPVQNG